MFTIAERSREPEILDNLNLQGNELTSNLCELEKVNRLLGGHHIIVKILQKILDNQFQKTWHIADLGSGGGDTLAAIALKLKNFDLQLTGEDFNPQAIAYARERYKHLPSIEFKEADILKHWQGKNYDVVMFNLFLHHFSDTEIVEILKKADYQSNHIIINDLQRSWLPYHLFRGVSHIFRFSYISRHDGKLSVKKSFTKNDWQRLLCQAGLKNFSIRWKWAFRWVVEIETNDNGAK